MSAPDTTAENIIPVVPTLASLNISPEAHFAEMETLVVSVDIKNDPDVSYIGGKLVEVREANRRAQTLYIRIQRALGIATNKQLEIETSYDILLSSLVENDSDVRSGSSGPERLAVAGNKLIPYKRAGKEAKQRVRTLQGLEKALNFCIRNLKSTNDDIKAQSKLMEAMLYNLKLSDMGQASQNPFLKETMDDLAAMDKLADSILEQQGSEDTVEIVLQEPEFPPLGGVEKGDSTIADGEGSESVKETEVEDGPEDHIAAPVTDTLPADDDFEFTFDPGLTGAPSASDAPELVLETFEEEAGPLTDPLEVPSTEHASNPVATCGPEVGYSETGIPGGGTTQTTDDEEVGTVRFGGMETSDSTAGDDDDIMDLLMDKYSDDEDMLMAGDPEPAEEPLSGLDGLDGLVAFSEETEAKAPKLTTPAVETKRFQDPPAVGKPTTKTEPKKAEKPSPSVEAILTGLGVMPSTKKVEPPIESMDDLLAGLGL